MGAGTSAARTRPGVQVTTDDVFPVFARAGHAPGNHLLLPPVVAELLAEPPTPRRQRAGDGGSLRSSPCPSGRNSPSTGYWLSGRETPESGRVSPALVGDVGTPLVPHSPTTDGSASTQRRRAAARGAARPDKGYPLPHDPASPAELAWLTVKGPHVFPMLGCMLARVLAERPEGEQAVVGTMLRAIQGTEDVAHAGVGTEDAPRAVSHRELLPEDVVAMLPEEAGGEEDTAGGESCSAWGGDADASAIEASKRAAYVAEHRVHLQDLFGTVVRQLLTLRPELGRDAPSPPLVPEALSPGRGAGLSPAPPADPDAPRPQRVARALRRLAVLNAHPVALTSPHFPFMRLAVEARRGVSPPPPETPDVRRLSGTSDLTATLVVEPAPDGRATPGRKETLSANRHTASPSPTLSAAGYDGKRASTPGSGVCLVPYSVERRRSSAYSVASSVAGRRRSRMSVSASPAGPGPASTGGVSSAPAAAPPRVICWTSELVGCTEEADVHEVYQHLVGTACDRIRRVLLRQTEQRYWPHDGVCFRIALRQTEWKAMSWQLKQQQCLADVGAAVVPPAPIHYTPFVLVSWMGARVAVTTALPHDDDPMHPPQLVVGDETYTATAGYPGEQLPSPYTPPQLLGSLFAGLGRVAHQLRLPGVLPGDVRLVRGGDGRVYSLPPVRGDGAAEGEDKGRGVLPVFEPRLGANAAATASPVRRELLEQLPEEVAALPVDASRRIEALRGLFCAAAARFAVAWGGSALWEERGVVQELHGGDWSDVLKMLKAKLHEAGLSLCHLGAVRKELRPSLAGAAPHQALCVEMAARAFKYVLNAQWRRVLLSRVEEPEQEARLVAGNLMALLVSAGEEPTKFWQNTLTPLAAKLFACDDIHTHLIPKRPLFNRVCELTGCTFAPAYVAAVLGRETSFIHLPCVAIRPRLKAFSPSTLRHAASLPTRENARATPVRPTTVAEALRPPKILRTADVAIPSARDVEALASEYQRGHIELAVL
eukprot:TRINITY_DN5286_c0_g2_i1.p1 TRINITY_DN5286_c0_g2~~TRINITY_DN5286_c0_g2_i1.p1  ORF type:complete len:997 (+),score=281.41 TRINITY_DN5286_c0_g2_i1:43-3033(+)